MSGSTQPEPGKRPVGFSLTGPVLAAVTTPTGTVEIRNSTAHEAFIDVVPTESSPAGELEATALLASWMGIRREPAMAEAMGPARPEFRFDIPPDVAAAHPMHVRLWLPAGSQYTVGTDDATVTAEGTFGPSRVSSEEWNADIGLKGSDMVTIGWEQEHTPTRTVLHIESASGSVTVDKSGCEVAVKIDGPAAVRNVSGNVVVFNQNGDTRVEHINGNVRVHSRGGDLTAKDVHRLDFLTTTGKLASLEDIGELGDYVRAADRRKPTPPPPEVAHGLQALAVARSIVDGSGAQLGDPAGDTLELPPGKEGHGKVIVTLAGPLPPPRDVPKR